MSLKFLKVSSARFWTTLYRRYKVPLAAGGSSTEKKMGKIYHTREDNNDRFFPRHRHDMQRLIPFDARIPIF